MPDEQPNDEKPADETRAPSEPVTIVLRKPVSLDVKTGNGVRTKTVAEITIRPPKGKDLRRIDRSKSPTVIALDMASWLSGEPSQVIDEIEGADLREVLKVVDRFFVDTLATGEKP